LTPPAVRPTTIRFENIDKRYGGLYALRRVSLEVAAGECVALAGRNGSGKTTLLRIAARLVRPSSGKVSFSPTEGGENIAASNAGFVAHATMVYDELTAEENLLLFARLQGIAQPTKRVEEMLREVGLFERRDSLVRTFSRGMRQRLAIARALLATPQLLLFDEPAAGLDPEGQHWLGATLATLHASGCTILMSTHGRSETQSSVTRAVRLDNGAVTHDSGPEGNPEPVLALAAVREIAEGGGR
jgi:heme exporter protein A